MEAPSPARLYAALVGAFLLSMGIVAFFYSASFGTPGEVEKALGTFDVNAWANLLYVATGAIGLLAAGVFSRPYALAAGDLYTVLAVWGFAIGGGEAVLSILPSGGADDALRLAIGLLGLAAAAATPRIESRGSFQAQEAEKEPRDRSEPGAQAAG
jgi:Domain of unknown function (DUF4383)